jgi:hypothetical protein
VQTLASSPNRTYIRLQASENQNIGRLPDFPLCGSEEHAAPRGGRRAGGGNGVDSVYGEPVDVEARADGRPVGFVWRSRKYTVRTILEHWVVNRDWWREGEPGRVELEFWRVEAALGPGMTAGVYELRRDAVTSAWTLRALHRALHGAPPPVRNQDHFCRTDGGATLP